LEQGSAVASPFKAVFDLGLARVSKAAIATMGGLRLSGKPGRPRRPLMKSMAYGFTK